MPPTALKRKHPGPDPAVIAPGESHRAKRHLTTFASSRTAQAQTEAIQPADLWKSVTAMDVSTLQSLVYNATTGGITLPPLTFEVLDAHHARIRAEKEAAENERRLAEARAKRQRSKIIEFDHHYRQINSWLSNDPVDRKPCRIVWRLIEERLLPRIQRLVAKAVEPKTNFASKYNALEALRKIAECIILNRVGSNIGCNAFEYLANGSGVEQGMLEIFVSMGAEERREVKTLQLEEDGV